MLLDQLQFKLPEELVATLPVTSREDARLFVYDRKSGAVEHSQVRAITQWLKPTDLLIFNQTRVRAARIEWKKSTGGEGELLLLRCVENNRNFSIWEALVSGRRLKPNVQYDLGSGVSMTILGRVEGARSRIELSKPQREIDLWMEAFGKPPLPPYI